MRKNKFQMKREETYHRLIENGIEVLLEKSYSKTSIDDIVNAAGFSRGAFYFHFKSKEDYFFHIMSLNDKRRAEDWSMLPYQFDPETTSLRDMLEISLITNLHNEFNKTNREGFSGWALVVIEFYQTTKNDPSIKRRLKEIHQFWEDDLTTLITALQERGFISASIKIENAVNQFLFATNGFFVNHDLYDKKDLNLLFEAYLKIFTV